MREVLSGLNPAADARLLADIASAEETIDPRDLPLVAIGPDSLDRLTLPTCPACGQARPSARQDAAPARAQDAPNEDEIHRRKVLRKHTTALSDIAWDMSIEGPFLDSAERGQLIAAARAVLQYVGVKP